MKNKLLVLAAVIGTWWLAARSETRLLVVTSGSMEPAIPVGSLIAVAAKDRYSAGDIISFNEVGGGGMITHRVSRLEEIDGKLVYFTKGDRNEEEDINPVYFNKVAGKVVVVIPKPGEVFLRLKKFISLAFFADQETSTENRLAAGTMDLKISDADETAGDSLTMTWEGSNLRPGQGEVSADLKIKNMGTVAANHIHIKAANAITQGGGPGANGSDPMDANLEVKTLTYDGADIKSFLTDTDGNGVKDLDDWEAGGDSGIGTLSLIDLGNDHVLSLTVGLRAGASGANQGDIVTTTFSIIGHQLDGE